jgi:hypothetical protein
MARETRLIWTHRPSRILGVRGNSNEAGISWKLALPSFPLEGHARNLSHGVSAMEMVVTMSRGFNRCQEAKDAGRTRSKREGFHGLLFDGFSTDSTVPRRNSLDSPPKLNSTVGQ